jgi:hypothetical protein
MPALPCSPAAAEMAPPSRQRCPRPCPDRMGRSRLPLFLLRKNLSRPAFSCLNPLVRTPCLTGPARLPAQSQTPLPRHPRAPPPAGCRARTAGPGPTASPRGRIGRGGLLTPPRHRRPHSLLPPSSVHPTRGGGRRDCPPRQDSPVQCPGPRRADSLGKAAPHPAINRRGRRTPSSTQVLHQRGRPSRRRATSQAPPACQRGRARSQCPIFALGLTPRR